MLEPMPNPFKQFAQTQRQQDLDPIGPQDDPCPGRTETSFTLVLLDFKAGSPADEMSSQPADPGSNDDDFHDTASFRCCEP